MLFGGDGGEIASTVTLMDANGGSERVSLQDKLFSHSAPSPPPPPPPPPPPTGCGGGGGGVDVGTTAIRHRGAVTRQAF
ncbi:hypothetical protein CRUP_038704 [Coryphaenoides rupestris]|nr:hypothetical protein CRUP_038704 [Coryphaenoides rupestris]